MIFTRGLCVILLVLSALSHLQRAEDQNNREGKPAITAMHGPQTGFDIGHCTVIHCDAGYVSLVDQ